MAAGLRRNPFAWVDGAELVWGSDLEIDPPPQVHPARIDPHDDHRIAMGFAVCGLRARGIVIENAECVEKTLPDFFDRLAKLRPPSS